MLPVTIVSPLFRMPQKLNHTPCPLQGLPSVVHQKGLGEMNADQLWETTMNPATRNLTQVTVEDAAKAERMITTLMGDKVDGRKEFLAKYANFDKRDGFIERRKQTEKKEED